MRNKTFRHKKKKSRFRFLARQNEANDDNDRNIFRSSKRTRGLQNILRQIPVWLNPYRWLAGRLRAGCWRVGVAEGIREDLSSFFPLQRGDPGGPRREIDATVSNSEQDGKGESTRDDASCLATGHRKAYCTGRIHVKDVGIGKPRVNLM